MVDLPGHHADQHDAARSQRRRDLGVLGLRVPVRLFQASDRVARKISVFRAPILPPRMALPETLATKGGHWYRSAGLADFMVNSP